MRDNRVWLWRVANLGLALLAGKAAQRAMGVVWARATGTAAPLDPTDRRQELLPVLAFGLGAGALAGVLRAIAHRNAAFVWEAIYEERPPGVD